MSDQPGSSPPSTQARHFARRKAIGRWLRRSIYALVGLAVAAGLIVAWMPRPVPVEVGAVERGPLKVVVEEDGQARVKDRYVVSAPLTGALARIELHAGDDVKTGQVVARIVPLLAPLLDERTRVTSESRLAGAMAAKQQAMHQIERAEATAALARLEVERLQKLRSGGAATQQQLDDATLNERRVKAELESLRFGVQVADHEVEMARATLKRLRPGTPPGDELVVTAPVTGRVLKVLRESEGAVQVGAPLIELGDPAALEIAVDVLTSDAVRIRPGAGVRIDRWGGEALEGQVRRIEPSAFSRISALGVEEQRVNVLVALTSPREKWTALGDGYRVEVSIVVWEGASVDRVPASAVFRHGDGWALYRSDDGVARLTTVQLGERTPREVQVLKGVSPGDTVILHPSDHVVEGVKVKRR